MENYIIEQNNAFTEEFCDEIIDICSINMEQIYNITQKYYKNTLNNDNAKIKIFQTINNKVLEVFEKMNENYKEENKVNKIVLLNDYIFLKFEKNNGYISYLNDFKVFKNKESFLYPRYNFIIFLNYIENGGCVEIMGNYKIQPEKGKMMIFPTGWCFPHSHKIPFANDKYAICGKIYDNFI